MKLKINGAGKFTALTLDAEFLKEDAKLVADTLLVAIQDAAKQAGLHLIEPLMGVEVITPDQFMGEVIGDLNARRGKVTGMEPRADADRGGPPALMPKTTSTKSPALIRGSTLGQSPFRYVRLDVPACATFSTTTRAGSK